jgi:hypothetical protein
VALIVPFGWSGDSVTGLLTSASKCQRLYLLTVSFNQCSSVDSMLFNQPTGKSFDSDL